MRVVAALDVGGTLIKGALIDERLRIVTSLEASTRSDLGPEAVVSRIRRKTAELLDRAGEHEVAALGVVVPGFVDSSAGNARYSANIGWHQVPLRALLATDTGRLVALGHDVRSAVQAEVALGQARGVDECAIIVIGTGVAAALISAGHALVGARGLAGELGHVPIRTPGEPCACGGHGCLETYGSAAALTRRYAAATGTTLSPPDIIAMATAGEDPVAARIWSEAISALATGLVMVTLLHDPELLVVGGGLSTAGATLLDPLRELTAARLTWRDAPRIELSSLGGRAGCIGAAMLAWSQL